MALQNFVLDLMEDLLIVQLPVGESAEYINFHVGDLYRAYRKDGMEGGLPAGGRHGADPVCDCLDARRQAADAGSPVYGR